MTFGDDFGARLEGDSAQHELLTVAHLMSLLNGRIAIIHIVMEPTATWEKMP